MQDDAFDAVSREFMDWIRSVDGVEVSPKIDLHDYTLEGGGRGVIATQDIAPDELLFSIPRSLLLSWDTSMLARHCSRDLSDQLSAWDKLLLVMLFEHGGRSSHQFWAPYFKILPSQFSTPMFWRPDEVDALQASSLRDKIGREEADQSYAETILPTLQAYASLFDVARCGIDQFHRMGSLIMAYSFDISDPAKSQAEDDALDVSEDEDEEDEDEKFTKVMCPLADLLNADTLKNNARLFHEPTALVMRATKAIEQGQQVYNTYGDLPNSDLLRRYGYIQSDNENDTVEISGDAVTRAVSMREDERVDRVDWLLDAELLDDSFEIGVDGKIPKDLIATLHVLMASPSDFETMKQTEETPKPIKTPEIQGLIRGILQRQMSRYATRMTEDQSLLATPLPVNMQNAVRLRLREKEILSKAIETVKSWDVVSHAPADSRKRAGHGASHGSGKRTRME